MIEKLKKIASKVKTASTRSFIGIESKNGTITYIYCHYDGYLTGVGKILKNHWNNSSKIKKLMKLGDLSYLGKEIGKKQDFKNPTNKDWCLAYGRDRGETGVSAKKTKNRDKLDQEYNYLFIESENKWVYEHEYNGVWKDL